MQLIKRLQATVVGSFDSLMTRVENHEAIIEAAVRETRMAAGKARGRIQRVRRDMQVMQKRIDALQEEETAWSRRAVELPKHQEEKALECVRRLRRARQEREHLVAEAAKQETLEQQLTADLRKVEERIRELERRKNTLSAREYRTRAVEAGSLETRGIIDDLDEIFDRWEVKLAEKEPYTSWESDTFEAEFIQEEEEKDLRKELSDLRAESKESKS
jgi:phage shock protein A